MKTYFKINRSLVTAFFLGTLLMTLTIGNNAFAQIENTTLSDYKPMYDNPAYSNKSLDPSSNTLNQEQVSQKPQQAPPPGEPDPANQVPVSSNILPLLGMALGLVLWKFHFQLKKAKK